MLGACPWIIAFFEIEPFAHLPPIRVVTHAVDQLVWLLRLVTYAENDVLARLGTMFVARLGTMFVARPGVWNLIHRYARITWFH
jgi:hypothetical protein